MARFVVTLLSLLALGAVLLGPAQAAGCASAAAQVASQTGGQVTGVRQVGNKCHIRVLIPSSSGPPKSRVIVVSL